MDVNEQQYFGSISLIVITNVPDPDFDGTNVIKDFTEESQKFVIYPDCQQWILWLPDAGRNYESVTITDSINGKVIYKRMVEDILSGSIQILLDSLFIPPGKYTLEIVHQNHYRHILEFEKHKEIIQERCSISATPNSEGVSFNTSGYIQYRDGFGNILPDEDLLLRNKVLGEIQSRFFPKVTYENYGRGGYAVYTEGDKSIKFEMEYGGGECVFYLFVPSTAIWQSFTGFPLSERDRIISYVASCAQRDQASGCRYEITEEYITYYRR